MFEYMHNRGMKAKTELMTHFVIRPRQKMALPPDSVTKSI